MKKNISDHVYKIRNDICDTLIQRCHAVGVDDIAIYMDIFDIRCTAKMLLRLYKSSPLSPTRIIAKVSWLRLNDKTFQLRFEPAKEHRLVVAVALLVFCATEIVLRVVEVFLNNCTNHISSLNSAIRTTAVKTDNSMTGVKSSADGCSLILTFHTQFCWFFKKMSQVSDRLSKNKINNLN